MVIDKAEIEFSPSSTVLSGETGAGKTVLSKALGLLRGEGAGPKLIRNQVKEAYVEAEFFLLEHERALWQEYIGELCSIEEYVVLARKVTLHKSGAFLNGRQCPLELLKKLAKESFIIHDQAESQHISKLDRQQTLVDRGLGSYKLLEQYRSRRKHLQGHWKKRDELIEQLGSADREEELLKFELAELYELPDSEDLDELFDQFERLSRARDNAQAVSQALQNFEDARQALQTAGQILNPVSDTDFVEEILSLLQEAQYKTEQLNQELDEGREARLASQLSQVHDLARKHRLQPSQLANCTRDKQAELERISEKRKELLEIEVESERLEGELLCIGEELSLKRQAETAGWLERLHQQLPAVALDGMEIQINWIKRQGEVNQRAGAWGLEDIQILLRSGPGMKFGTIGQVASGGERSRLVLALLGLQSQSDGRIFVMDEPDSGIGGQTAHEVGKRIQALAKEQQVILISHLPQIAARSDRHYVVEKLLDESTRTHIFEVSGEARLDELCRMGGYDPKDLTARSAVHAMHPTDEHAIGSEN